MIITRYAQDIYSSYNVNATGYVYNASGGKTASSGWYKVEYDELAVQIGVGTLTATSLEFIVEGKVTNNSRPCEIYNASLNSSNDSDIIINVTEPLSELRVGVKVNNVATPNSLHCAIIRSEVR